MTVPIKSCKSAVPNENQERLSKIANQNPQKSMSGNHGVTHSIPIPLPAVRCILYYAVFLAFYACYHIAAD